MGFNKCFFEAIVLDKLLLCKVFQIYCNGLVGLKMFFEAFAMDKLVKMVSKESNNGLVALLSNFDGQICVL